MRIQALTAVACAAGITLAACTTNQLGVTPNIQFTPSNGKLFASVGTANIAGSPGLNVLATFRSPNGLTAVPISQGSVTGPAGFAGAAGSADPGAGAAMVPFGSQFDFFTLQSCLFGCSTSIAGIDGYGVGPPGDSASNSGPNLYPTQPQFGDTLGGAVGAACGAPELPFYGGPPAYPAQTQQFGFPEGFYVLATGTPPTGTYTVTATYKQNGNTSNANANATLGSATLLPAMPVPSFTSDGAGGGGGTVTLPAGVTEAMVDIIEISGATGCFPGAKYATAVVKGSGATAYSITGAGLDVGAPLAVQAIGFNYDAFALGPPSNHAQNPGLPAQANVTISAQTSATE